MVVSFLLAFAKRSPVGSEVSPASRVDGSCEQTPRSDVAIAEELDQSLGRSQRRMLRRIYNGRTVPIIVDGRHFLTYKEASRYLLSLTPDAREDAYAEMRSVATSGSGIQA